MLGRLGQTVQATAIRKGLGPWLLQEFQNDGIIDSTMLALSPALSRLLMTNLRFIFNGLPQMKAALELSENDPNTFRDIVDDLTVQNKGLKRQLKRYERMQSISKEHNGLFEVRIHKLPPHKKHELEVILQNFAATVHSSQYESGPMLATTGRLSSHHVPEMHPRRCSPSPSSVQALDSAYASVSATRVTIPTVRKLSTRPGTISHKQPHATTLLGISSVPQSSNEAANLDRTKREFIVLKLAQLFDNDVGTLGVLNEGDKAQKKVRYRHPVTPKEPVLVRAPASLGSGSQSMKHRSHEAADTQSHHRFHTTESLLSQSSVASSSLLQRNEAREHQQQHPPDQLHHPGDPRVTYSVDEPSLQPSDEWLYLNILVNMAQLHTLNVTLDFVRNAIHESSTRLVLSNDGCKVKWQSFVDDANWKPEEAFGSATTPLAFASESRSVEHVDRSYSIEGKDGVQELSASDFRDRPLLGSFSHLMVNKAADSTSHYKPMFTPRKPRSALSQNPREDQSVDSDMTSPSTTSFLAKPNIDNQSGPMIFLDRDPFFLDLSADPPKCDSPDQAQYGRLLEEPLGGRNGSSETYGESERRPSHSIPAGSREALLNFDEDIPFRSLALYDDDAAPASRTTTRAEHVELEASGIGGIQLDDNFAIDVTTAEQDAPSSQTDSPRIGEQALQTISGPSNRVLPSHPRRVPAPHHHRRLVSTITTHLSPSPLPPPSYVYPARSSSCSSSDTASDDEILDDVESVSGLEFRPLSLSPQMRMFLEDNEEASEPKEDDEDIEVEGQDGD
ncbi:MAG: hypothetical protein Q9169_001607 [Polycauliona sp. 2 TL-2023]